MSTKLSKYSINNYFMNLALKQAYKVLGNTKKNPAVGCVIVKNNSMISAGSTSIYGRPHAEQNAINCCRRKIRNSVIYITLEPCSHYGKTHPCVKKIIKKQIRKVVFSINDPDIRSFNKSTTQLKKSKIIVESGVLKNKVRNFYKSYFNFKKKSLPYVTAKIAASKDLYTNQKDGRWITNESSRARVHLMRSQHDCILTSYKTINSDNPKLTCRINGLSYLSPTPIILDKKISISIKSNILKSSNSNRTIIFYNNFNKNKLKFLQKNKVKLIKMPTDKRGFFDLTNILNKIKLLGFSRIFLESGLNLTRQFLKEGLINDFQLFISNKKLGKNGSNNIKKTMKTFLQNKKFIKPRVNLYGDKLISYRLK